MIKDALVFIARNTTTIIAITALAISSASLLQAKKGARLARERSLREWVRLGCPEELADLYTDAEKAEGRAKLLAMGGPRRELTRPA